MMRHLILIVAVIYAVIGDGWAQNRGSAKYVPPEDFDVEITRAPRPTRGSIARRQRPTKALEPDPVEEELKNYQPPESPVRRGTTARRVPQRGLPQQTAPLLPVEETAPRYPAVEEDLPEVAPVEPESRPQNPRRRRPKKRRKPQATVSKPDEEGEKQVPGISEREKIAVTELLNEDKKRTDVFHRHPSSQNSPSNFESDPSFQPEKTSWESNPTANQPQRSAAGPQYFRPQPAINRLPVEDSEPVRDSQGYFDSSPVDPGEDITNSYIPKGPSTSVSNKASYVPVLPPIRVPLEGPSRLPHEDYPPIRNIDSAKQVLSNPNTPLRSDKNRSPVADPEEIIRNTDAKPVHNIIPQSNEPSIPTRSHSEVRLPHEEQPLLSPEYVSPDFDSVEDLIAPNAKTSESIEEQPNPSNRLPNPSEIHYDSVYPEFLENHPRGSQRIAGRRQEVTEPAERNPLPSYASPRRDSGTKPQEYDNDAEIDRRQVSQYQPPLQRAGSRYKPEDFEGSSRPRTQQQPPTTTIPRGRGASRYHQPTDEYVTERIRSSTKPREESSTASPPRRRNPSAIRTRGSQRYVPETVDSGGRTSSRRQPITAEPSHRDTPPAAGYVPIDEIIKNEQRSSPHASRTINQPPAISRTENEPADAIPIRNTLRSRPQYEIRNSEPTDTHEESIGNPNEYNSEYEVPRQTRRRTNQRASSVRQHLPQPEYQTPPNRQQNREEFHNEPPSDPHSRYQPQYQAPQNTRANTRQPQNAPSARQQGRPRSQQPAPSPPRSRSSGGSNFVCPESFGFFPDPVQCDKYYECRNGTAEMNLCSDGLAFNEISAPKFLRCDSLRDVDCKSRPELQEPRPSKNCPRRFGLFPHETDCTKFWNCVDGTATEVQCPPGLTYNDERATCDWADLVETSCKTEDLLGFTCPEPTPHDLQDGVYSRYPHPDNCQLHFTCIKGADGLRRPRMLSCNEGLVFDPKTSSCTRPEQVPGCEDFYGDRSPPPRRKPARRPVPTEPEEEFIEESTPRPRRRGSIRRARN